jgi:predicted RNA-binding protein YlxR (DUF448 family)
MGQAVAKVVTYKTKVVCRGLWVAVAQEAIQAEAVQQEAMAKAAVAAVEARPLP